MSQSLHHIRLLAALELEVGLAGPRTLTRTQAEKLAGELGSDLQRAVADVAGGMLAVAGSVFEPGELLRPQFPVWSSLGALVMTAVREQGFEPRIMAIGSHNGRMPHAELQPPDSAPVGQFVALPMVLLCPKAAGARIENALEHALFESASIGPPARALLSEAIGLDSMHGQLLTLSDLVALQHVQFDAVGLSPFWALIERLLIEPERAAGAELPAGLRARWQPDKAIVDIDFKTFDQSQQPLDDYIVWLRAFRTLTALLDTHTIGWQVHTVDPVVLDVRHNLLIESVGPAHGRNGVTAQRHPDLGLVAWSVVEDGRLIHLYPLEPQAAESTLQDLITRGLPHLDDRPIVHHDPDSGRLLPADGA